MSRPRFLSEAEVYRLPQPPAPAITPTGFSLAPLSAVTVEQWMWLQLVYRQAFEQAQAVARPSLPERDLLAVWN